MTSTRHALTVDRLEVAAYQVPTEQPESDGTLDPEGGKLVPDASRPGLGLELKRADAERFRV
jgi:hypothetical protein